MPFSNLALARAITLGCLVACLRGSLGESSMCGDESNLPPRVISRISVRHGCEFSDAHPHPVLHAPYFLGESIIIDVGANDGKNLAAPSPLSQAKLIAFEPQPSMSKLLYNKLLKNKFPTVQLEVHPGEEPDHSSLVKASRLLDGSEGGVVVVPAAAGNEPAKLPIYVAAGAGTKMVSLSQGNMPGDKRTRKRLTGKKMAEVASFPLDALFSQDSPLRSRNVSLLKIDAQGFELNVVKGASEILTSGRVGAVQFEFCPLMIHNAQQESGRRNNTLAGIELLERMRQAGKLCFQVQETSFSLLGNVASFERYAQVHFDEASTCGTLGCATEIICLPMCSSDAQNPEFLLKTIENLSALSGCSTDKVRAAASGLKAHLSQTHGE